MRAIRSLSDVQIVLKQILDWQSNKDSKDWDFSGLRIKNASPSKDPNDYVIRSELHPNSFAAPPVTSAPQTQAQVNNPPDLNSQEAADHYYTMVFTVDTVTDGYETPSFVAGINRDGVIVDVWVTVNVGPTLVPALINFNINGHALLTTDISIPVGSTAVHHSGKFVSPLPVIGFDTKGSLKVNTASDVAGLSGGIVVRRNKKPRN